MDHYAVIGHPVAHSLSPAIHQAFAKQTEQAIDYQRIEAPLDGFSNTLQVFRAQGGKGCSITLPFKELAYQMATTHSSAAQEAGAANTLVFKDNEAIHADNTDGPGLIQDLTKNHNASLRQKKILVLGAGGVVRGILGPLLAQAPCQLRLANRTAEKAEALAQQFRHHGDIQGCGLNNIVHEPADLIINATSASVYGERPEISSDCIGDHTWCYDLFYSRQPTAFLQWAKQHHAARCIDGLGMLVEQAAMQFYLWRGVYPDTRDVIQGLMSSLSDKKNPSSAKPSDTA